MSTMPRYKTGKGIKKHFDFIAADFIILGISYLLATIWYHLYISQREWVLSSIIREQALILFVCLVLAVFFGEPYKKILKRTKWQEVAALFKHIILMVLLNIFLMFIMHDTNLFSRLTFGVTWIVYFVLELCFRLLWKRIIRHRIFNNVTSRRQIIVLTTHNEAETAVNNLCTNMLRDYDIPAVFLSDYDPNRDEGVRISESPILGNVEDMLDYAVHEWVDEAILNISDPDLSRKIEKDFTTMSIPTHHTMMLLKNSTGANVSYIEKIGNYVVLTHKNREIAPAQIFFKRLLDLAGGLIGSVFAVLIMIIVGPIIKHKSPGPIIFAQKRVGQNGKVFKMYKIRSMYMDAEERKKELLAKNKMDGFMFKMDDDPRIIGSEKKDKNGKPKGIGNFIRKTSLDEFPQFFNVLKGDMSLVGTRPPTLDEWEKYSIEHRKRLSIRPGITGLWQISGRSDITDFDEVVRLDSEYIDNWTVGMDLEILAKTVGKVFRHEGAE